MEVHESPNFSVKSGGIALEAGMIMTVEPGIYLPGFGVRSELDVYLGEDGPEITGERQSKIVQIETR